MDFSSQEQRTGGARNPRPAGALHHRTRASRSNGRPTRSAKSAIEYFIAGKPQTGPGTALLHDLADDQDVPAAKVACTLETSAGKATVEHRGRAGRAHAADRRRSRRTERGRTRRSRRRSGRRRRRLGVERGPAARPAAPAPPPSLCRPCSASGWPGALDIRRASSGAAHRHRVLGARGRAAARPPRPRRSGRIAGIRSWTVATTSFGVVVTIVQL